MFRKYDLDDLGYKYNGVASKKNKTIKNGDWTIIDIPEDIKDKDAVNLVGDFIRRIVSLEIPTSLKCNLRCNYCYISDPRLKNINVKGDDVYNIMEAASNMFPGLSKNPEIRKSIPTNKYKEKAKVFLSPWGAEPFANLPTLNKMYDFAHTFYGKDNYQMTTSTNGTLSSDNVFKLIEKLIDDDAFQSVQVSLDGPKELQDYQRPTFDGKGSYDKIRSFCHKLIDLQRDRNLKYNLYTFCSTIHLVDDFFEENWINAGKFFSEPNTWHTSVSLPMRMSGEDLTNPDHINKFINAQKGMLELVKSRAEEGISIIDFYTAKLFGTYTCKSKNAYPYCSALNTQIAVDLDGNIYPCHGPITSPLYKPFLYIGNLFEKIISYKQLFRNYNYQFGILWSQGKCENCPLYKYCSGSICWSCPPHNLALTGEPSMDSPLKCIAYQESLKYWIAMAKIVFDDSINNVMDRIPKNWYNDIEIDFSKFKNQKFQNIIPQNIHYDMSYNGLIGKALDLYTSKTGDTHDYGYTRLKSEWWNYDDFINHC